MKWNCVWTQEKSQAAKLQAKSWNKLEYVYAARPFAVSQKIEKNKDNRHP